MTKFSKLIITNTDLSMKSKKSFMSNLTKYLVIVGIMIAIGAMLLIYGSQTITGDLVIEEGKINSLTQLEIKTELDPDINTQGVYAVQTIEGKEYDISAIVIDPSEVKIRDVSINRNSFEDNFEIDVQELTL